MGNVEAQLDLLNQRFHHSDISIGGHTWRYIDTAAPGEVLVMLPGSVGTGATFVSPLLALGDSIRMIAVTYPAIASPTELAEGLAGLFEHLGLPPAFVLGSSFGAYWAQFFALAYPSQVRGLILGNGFVDASDLAGQPLFERNWVESTPAGELHETWLARVRAAPDSDLKRLQEVMLTSHQSADNLKARFVGVVNAEPCPPLSLAPDRITILECDDDPLITPAARQRLRNHYFQAHHERLTTGGHYPHVLAHETYQRLLSKIVARR